MPPRLFLRSASCTESRRQTFSLGNSRQQIAFRVESSAELPSSSSLSTYLRPFPISGILSAGMADLEGLRLLGDISRRDLIHALESMSGPKDLVVDATLTRPLDLIANMRLLQAHEVVRVQQLAANGPSNVVWSETARFRVYIVRPTMDNAMHIAKAVRANPDRKLSACFVDRRTHVVESVFEHEGVFGKVTLFDLCLSLLCLDHDLFSLEMPTGDNLYSSARALWQLQALYGEIPKIFGIGKLSQRVYNLTKTLAAELGDPRPVADRPLSHLFLFDRNYDPHTPLLTSLTYESMLNDHFNVSCGKANFEEVGKRMPKAEGKATPSLKAVPLSDVDPLFSHVRNRHMSAAAAFLSSRIKELEAKFESGTQRTNDLRNMREFVNQDLQVLLDEYRSVELHLSVCEIVLEKSAASELTKRIEVEGRLLASDMSGDEVLNFLLEEIIRKAKPWSVIQLACLASLALDGLPQKHLITFRQHLVHAYGYDYLLPLATLQSEGLLKEKASLLPSGPAPPAPVIAPTAFPSLQTLIRRLSLKPGDGVSVDIRNPTHMSYVFTGIFTPPFCQVVADIVAPQLYLKRGSSFHEGLEKHVGVLHKIYRPTWWCPFGFLQTAVRQIFRSKPSLPFRREVVRFEDGGQLATDWLEPDSATAGTPIVFFLPGITGSTHDCAYILHTAMEAAAQGWRSCVVNPRGLGGVELLTPRTYNAAVTSDFQNVLQTANKRYPKAKKMGCGFSMGGMILWNYMAKCTKENVGLDGALVISSPWDPMDATFTIEELFPRLFFNSHLANNLRYKKLFEDIVDWEAVMKAKTVREFDRAFVVPAFGYKDWLEYYHDAALYYKVHQIPVPTLCLNAADDCFSPLKSIPFDEVEKSENVVVAVTRHGGHTAFMEETHPSARGLIENLFTEFGTMVFEHL